MAYILGFFAADGYMTKNKRGACFINFHIADLKLLSDIRKALNSNHKISKRIKSGFKSYRLQIGSKDIFTDLVRLGFKPNKYKNIKLPDIPPKFLPDFVRGYFDGDGNLWCGRTKNKKIVITSVFTSCSFGFLDQLRRKLLNYGIFGGSLVTVRGKYYRLSYSINDTLKLFNFMYNRRTFGKQALFLKRKYRIFKKFIKMRS